MIMDLTPELITKLEAAVQHLTRPELKLLLVDFGRMIVEVKTGKDLGSVSQETIEAHKKLNGLLGMQSKSVIERKTFEAFERDP